MKRKGMIRLLSCFLAVVLSTATFSMTAFAGGGEEEYHEPPATTEAEPLTEGTADIGFTIPEDFFSDAGSADIEGPGLDALLDTVLSMFGGMGDVTEEEETGPGRTGTVTTNGGRLNVRTGAGLDNTAFTQLPNGTTVEVIGEDGDWFKILLPERTGYVHSDYMSVSGAETGTDGGGFSFSIDPEGLDALLGMFADSLAGGGDAALSPDGNLSLIDDIGSATASGKQFITVESKNGNVFYLVIDRDDEGGETVHFLNQVDEADLMALTEDGETVETPAVCSCTDKCQAGAVDTACEVCMANMGECAGKEPEPVEPDEPEEPAEEKKGGAGAIIAVLLILAVGGGAALYFLVLKPKQGRKAPSSLDDLDLEDEEEYLDEDGETEDME